MKWLAPAKINLSLRVLGRRADGFHEIETLMAPITLADAIEIEPSDGEMGKIELTCSDPTLSTDDGNLAFRAAKCLQVHLRTPTRAVRIILNKRIPHGAGLGGGSSDAATVLLALNEFWGANFELPQLVRVAAELGSDVPFFLFRSAALCRGRGEQVDPFLMEETLPLLLLKPSFPVPTPWAYQRWKDSRELPGVAYKPQPFAWGELFNDLERPVYEKYLFLSDLKTWLLAQKEVAGAVMSGSGSTMFALLYAPGLNAARLADRAQAECGPLWSCICSTVAGCAGTLRTF